MKVTIINSRYFPEAEAGPAFSVQFLAEALARAGHRVHVVCLSRELPAGRDEHEGVSIHRLPPGISETRAGELVEQLLDELKPDVVHSNWLVGFPLAHLGAIIKKTGVRLVHTVREYRFLCARGTLYREGVGPCRTLCQDCGTVRPVSAEYSRHVDAVVGVSRFCLDVHLGAGLFAGADTRAVVANAFAGPDQPLAPRNEAAGSRLDLGYLGRISAYKGIFWLLSQLARSDLTERVTVTIAGRYPDGLPERLEEALPNLELCWLGFVPPRDLMQRIDWLVTPSLCHEPLARVVFEAFGFGRPVLASRVGGLPEMIEHGRNGRLFSPETGDDVLDQIRWIADHRDQWHEYRRAAWESRTRYLPEKIAEAYLSVYRGPPPDS